MFSMLMLLVGLAAETAARAHVQGSCARSDPALRWLEEKLSSGSAISCQGQVLQLHNANRYWGEQFGKNAAVVVFPGTTQDVSYAVRAASFSVHGSDFSIVGGGHSQINASSSYGFVLDLSWMNSSRVIPNFKDPDGGGGGGGGGGAPFAVIEYQGGANWAQVLAVTNGTGYTAVGARIASVGVGGFSLGGGIGFLAGAYGFAMDRLVQLEVVLPSGKIVTASRGNQYADLFWALQGGSGQFGIVTRFWQRAVPEPKRSTLALYYINDDDVPRLREQTVDFFENNKDPFCVVYYSFGFMPDSLENPVPASYAKRTLVITIHFEDATNPHQLNNTAAFAGLLDGIDISNSSAVSTEYYADLAFVGEGAYPYGYRRGFYGAQTSNIDVGYLSDLTDTFWAYVDTLMARGEHPYSASFVLQYMHPGLSGHLPEADDSTAWPHASAGHQTLFTPAYKNAENDGLTLNAVQALNDITHAQQRRTGGGMLANYPNYMAPGDSGHRVWGRNVRRLREIKQKYDPGCLIRNGRVFASDECVLGGWASVFEE